MNLQIINGCAGTDPELPTVGTDPGRRYLLRSQTNASVFLLTVWVGS